MKKNSMIIAQFVILIIMIMVQSCDKSENYCLADKQNEFRITTKEGILVFNSGEHLFNTLDWINKISPEEYSDWCTKLEFNSFNLDYNDLLSQLENLSSIEEVLELVDSNSDILQINDKNEIIPIFDFGVYSNLVSRNGYFYVNDVLTRVTNDNLYFSKKGKKAIQTAMETGKSENVEIVRSGRDIQTKNYGNYQSATKTDGRKRVRIYARLEETSSLDTYGEWTVRNYFTFEIKGFKKVLGIWYSYNTKYKYRNLSFTGKTIHDLYGGPGYMNPTLENDSGAWPGPEYSPGDAWGYKWSYQVGDNINGVHPANCNDPYFTTVNGEGTSRGLGYTEWATINCN